MTILGFLLGCTASSLMTLGIFLGDERMTIFGGVFIVLSFFVLIIKDL